MYEVGNTVNGAIDVRTAGILVDADALPVATITLPDATTVTTTVTHVSLGHYTCAYTTSQSGDHDLVWTGQVGGVNGPFPFSDSFYVFSPVDFVVSLDDAKRHLNITNTTSDAELRDFLLRAQTAVESQVGPILPVTITSRVGRFGNWATTTLSLPVTPVISLGQVIPVGVTATPVTGLTVSPAGVVSSIVAFFFATPYDVTYVAGRVKCPPDLYHGILEMLRHLWETQRGSNQTVWNNPESLDVTRAHRYPDLLPPQVRELLAPYEQAGFA